MMTNLQQFIFLKEDVVGLMLTLGENKLSFEDKITEANKILDEMFESIDSQISLIENGEQIKYEIIKEDKKEYYVRFTIGNQTFTLDKKDTRKSAKWYIEMLKKAFSKI